MIVIIDTTELYKDLRMKGANFVLLKTYLLDTSSTLIIPKVVFEETVNHFRIHLASHVKAYINSLSNVNKFIVSSEIIPEFKFDESEEVENFQAYLKQQITNLQGKLIGYGDVKLASLVQRALHRRKPFDGDGKIGFRDAIIWETILSEFIAKNDKDEEIFLITGNSKDFGKDENLAKDLCDDCENIGKSTENVRIFNKFQLFIDTIVKPHLNILKDIKEQIGEGKYREFDPKEFYSLSHEIIQDELSDHVQRCNFGNLTRSMFGHLYNPDLHSLDKTCYCEILGAWSVEEEQVAVDIDFNTSGEIECMEETGRYYPPDDERYSNWDEEELIGGASFTISMTVILNKETGVMADYQIHDVDIKLEGVRWPFIEMD